MHKKVKIRIMIIVTFLMSIGFILMGLKGPYIGCIILAFPYCTFSFQGENDNRIKIYYS